MTNLILTILVGFMGGIIALRLKVPAGAMVGSMIFTAAFNIATGRVFMPQDVKVVTQIAAGAFIGAGITRKDVVDLKFVIKPAVLMVLSMILLDLLMGYIMYKVTGVDLTTCLFASAPGGIVDMSLISSDMGADTSKVAILQMIRLLIVFIVLPPMMKMIHSKLYKDEILNTAREEAVCTDSAKADKFIENRKKLSKDRTINLLITLLTALIFGFIGFELKIPAGAMTFAMIAAGTLNIFTGRGYMPLNLRRATQVFAGILIGGRMTYTDVIALKSVIVPAIIMLVGIIFVNFCIGFFISRIGGIEIVTALLASAPGGVSDMALIAKDLGGDAPKVAIMQLARYVCIIAFFPVIIKYISLII
ncbi:AbrB family transcriptional regulator [Clostridium sp. YIM B02515]|uniref:AbrB family transcriptional regulator n=1 Tax=Clostridium rhizosphaerae TaxID=2803861 RepID=A0ABS1TFX8_9CLOT|nr:AbrB family transcriptional regulator [Clostridium rhizosphaerae]MBL4938225.1 AbrB family transcriptional regulator [Clostridium rhizosphaerae]